MPQADLDQYMAKRDVARSRVNERCPDYPADAGQSGAADQSRKSARRARESGAELFARPASSRATDPKRRGLRFFSEVHGMCHRKQAIEEFYKQDPHGRPRSHLRQVDLAVAEHQAGRRPKLEQARRDLDEAELNLRYCDVVSEIDGVVTRRNVNPGNNVQAGQSLMAVRSLTEIWIDANFKETQLADLRIGQRVRCEVDMYGRRRELRGSHHRLHHGDGPNAGAVATAKCHGQLREDRAATAGAD